MSLPDEVTSTYTPRHAAYYAANAERIKANSRQWRATHRAQARSTLKDWRSTHADMQTAQARRDKLKARYGLTAAEYDALLAEQNGCCRICRTTEPGRGYQHFSVDHDHTTGRVRGLLCHGCNMVLGFARDDQAILQGAIDYLERANVQQAH